jgi:hypothetical protein
VAAPRPSATEDPWDATGGCAASACAAGAWLTWCDGAARIARGRGGAIAAPCATIVRPVATGRRGVRTVAFGFAGIGVDAVREESTVVLGIGLRSAASVGTPGRGDTDGVRAAVGDEETVWCRGTAGAGSGSAATCEGSLSTGAGCGGDGGRGAGAVTVTGTVWTGAGGGSWTGAGGGSSAGVADSGCAVCSGCSGAGSVVGGGGACECASVAGGGAGAGIPGCAGSG